MTTPLTDAELAEQLADTEQTLSALESDERFPGRSALVGHLVRDTRKLIAELRQARGVVAEAEAWRTEVALKPRPTDAEVRLANAVDTHRAGGGR
jgi:hypothetical protein